MKSPPDPMDDLALAIGRATIAWGTLQDNLGHLFSAVLYGGLDDVALAAWHAHKNDRAQRDMLIEVAQVNLASAPELEKAVIKLAKRVHEMSNLRNEMIHAAYAPLTLSDGTVVPAPHGYFGNRCAKNLDGRSEANLLILFDDFRRKIDCVTRSSDEVFQRLVSL